MAVGLDQPTIHPLYSAGDELTPPYASYLISHGTRHILVDPGPAWHIEAHRDSLSRVIPRGDTVAVVIQSPLPAAFASLPLVEDLASKRTLIVHAKVAAMVSRAFGTWRVQELTTRVARFTLSASSRLIFGITPLAGMPGALMSFEQSTGTLFSGPFFGSLGAGQKTDIPVLRRECVRAYRDVYTPMAGSDIVEDVFGSELGINQIAPSYGRLAVGGSSLIRRLFREETHGAPVEHALHRMYVRIAALLGVDVASGIFRAAGVPIPEVNEGYAAGPEGPSVRVVDSDWHKAIATVEQWIDGRACTALYPLIAQLSHNLGLEIPQQIERFARAAVPAGVHIAMATAPGRRVGPDELEAPMEAADEARHTYSSRAVETAESRGTTAASATDEITDPVTGIMKETVFRQRLEGQFNDGSEGVGRGSVVFLGVDDIQRINTTFGRSGGDEALYTVAYLLRNFQSSHSRRGTHRLYKLSGPSFAYVIASGSVFDGAEVAEQIRRSVSESAMFLEQLTVSAGVVGLDEVELRAGNDPSRLVDDVFGLGMGRLQIARQSGSNTVCSADPEGTAGIGAGSTVLIADPDAPYLEMLTKQLEDQGYTVLLARDGAEAVGITEQIIPDAIVAEVMLPKRNGFAFRDELRHNARLSQIPFVLVSHRKTDEAIEKASLLGIVHFMQKPFSMVELTGLLRNLTRSRLS